MKIFNSVKFRNLALLICHLFNGGQFREGHILYDPSVFDGHLIAEIDSVCPVQIPWQLTDITRSSINPPINSNLTIRTDHVLQLIFFDPSYLAEQIYEFKNYLTFYRIFVLFSNSDFINDKFIGIIQKKSTIFDSSTLVVNHNVQTGSTVVNWVAETVDSVGRMKDRTFTLDPASDFDHAIFNAESKEMFEQTFGQYDHLRPLAIQIPFVFWKSTEYYASESIPIYNDLYLANYYYSTLNACYINVTRFQVDRDFFTGEYQVLAQKQRKHHGDLDFQYETIDESKYSKAANQFGTLHFSVYMFDKNSITFPLYPFDSDNFIILFVYGDNFKRHLNMWFIPGGAQTIFVTIIIFMCSAAIILCIIRHKFNLQQAGLPITFIHIIVAFIGGEDLRMHHKWEKWFFGILMVGAFFINSVYGGTLLDYVIQSYGQKMTKLEQLINLDTQMFIPVEVMDPKYANEILRQRVGHDVNFDITGIKNSKFEFLSQNYSDSFIYMINRLSAVGIEQNLIQNGRDYDVLHESLGFAETRFFLQSKSYVPDRILQKIDETTSTMFEKGFTNFFQSFTVFKRKFIERVYSPTDEDDVEALKMEQFIRPMTIIFYLWGFAILIFIAEFVVGKLNFFKNH